MGQEAPQVVREGRGRGVAALRVLLEGLAQDRLDVSPQPRVDAGERLGFLLADDAYGLPHLGEVELVGHAARHELVGHDAQGVDVATHVEGVRVAGGLLRAHVGNRADHLPDVGLQRHRRQVGIRDAGDPEVEHLRLPGGVDQHVARLEVAVDHSAQVRVVHRVGDLRDQLELLVEPECRVLDVPLERLALDQLHREERLADAAVLELSGFEDLCDARMLQSPEHFRLAQEAFDHVRRMTARGRDDLERHCALRMLLEGLVDDAHPSTPELLHDPVAADALADRELPLLLLPRHVDRILADASSLGGFRES